MSQKQTLGFQTEVKQLLHLMVHSLYSDKEIFLRELISNASDACDKLRFEALSDDKLYDGDNELKVRISIDQEAGTLTIADNGIGMSEAEVIENIGTIARSGTKNFLSHLTGDQKKDAQLIGQFGVGFYSSFIVADKVTLKTRRAGTSESEAVCWESDGQGEYTLKAISKEVRGTEVTLHFKDSKKEFLEDYRVQSIVKKFSDHISFPIIMKVEKESGEGEDKKTELVDETINQASALWTRPKSQIKTEEYNEFYKTVSHDFTDPLAYTHSKIEGNLVYTLLLYVPQKAPFDLWNQEHHHGLKLYVKRVFIMDDAEKLLPKYLRFVRGVVDSDDLPLNVSREILQENQIMASIRSNAVKKVLGLLEDLAQNQKDKYQGFWNEFGRVIKEGVVEDFSNKERIIKLCRFSSSFNDKEEQDVSLDDYIFRMKSGQDKIYYLIADSFNAAKNSPLLEAFRKKGIEVLLLSDRVDHWFVSHIGDYKEKGFESISQGDVDLAKVGDEDESKDAQKDDDAYKALINKIKDSLQDTVKDVRVSHRLVSSPACLVSDKNEMDSSMKRMFEAMGQEVPVYKPILEVNPEHALLKKLESESDKDRFNNWTQVIFDQAVLVDGGQLKDPAAFVKRLNDLIVQL